MQAENLNAPPSVSQQFTNEVPSSHSALFSQLPTGAQNFAREYMPDDDNKDCIVTFEVVNEFKPFKSQIKRDKVIADGGNPGHECEVYEDVIYIRKTIRGNDKLEVHRPMWETDKKEFPYAWQEFNRGRQGQTGTPLTKINLDAALIRSLTAKNVFSVEDFALVSDTWIQNLGPGAREHRKRAIEYLENNKYSKAVESNSDVLEMKYTLAEQKKMLDQAMELLRKQAEENEALKAQLTKPEPKKRGPKPKAVDAA
jgi:hypothetical protein